MAFRVSFTLRLLRPRIEAMLRVTVILYASCVVVWHDTQLQAAVLFWLLRAVFMKLSLLQQESRQARFNMWRLYFKWFGWGLASWITKLCYCVAGSSNQTSHWPFVCRLIWSLCGVFAFEEQLYHSSRHSSGDKMSACKSVLKSTCLYSNKISQKSFYAVLNSFLLDWNHFSIISEFREFILAFWSRNLCSEKFLFLSGWSLCFEL